MTNQPSVTEVSVGGFRSSSVEWGHGCQVYAPANIYRSKIGDRVRIGPFTEIQDGCEVGDDTVVCSHVFLAGDTVIGRRCFVGHGVITCNDRYPVANNKDWVRERVVIGDDVSIGSGAVLMPGVVIGSSVIIGAAAVVTKSIPDNTVVYSKTELVVRPR